MPVSDPVDPAGFDGMFDATLRALGQVGGAPGEGEDAEPLVGTGEGAGGLIRATATAGGRITDLDLNPRALRMGSAELSEEILAAVNGALDDLRTKVSEAAATPDLSGLAERLKEVQETSKRQLSGLIESLVAAQERIASAGRSS
jgi:hypothetical protein